MEPDREPPICDYEGSTYRTDFWDGQGREYEDRVERVALRRLLPPQGRRLLDVGAGFGRLASMYTGYGQVVLLDYSRSQLEHARQQLGDRGFTYVVANVYRPPLADDAFDTTVMVRVLHHIARVPFLLEQIRRMTRPQGTFVLEFANKRHLKNLLRCLIGRGINPFDRQPCEFADLHFDFHPAWISQRLQEGGYRIERRLSASLFRSELLRRIFPTAFLVNMDAALQGITAPLALGPSIFVRSEVTKSGSAQVVTEENLFRCPDCGHQPLDRQAVSMRCGSCQGTWPIENGLYVFK